MVGVVVLVWFSACMFVTWALSRWFRWLRGDFDAE